MKTPKKTDKKSTLKSVASGEKENIIKPANQKPARDFDDDDDFDLSIDDIDGLDDFNRFDDDDDF